MRHHPYLILLTGTLSARDPRMAGRPEGYTQRRATGQELEVDGRRVDQ
jgi:hypothetical protein